MNTRDKKKLIIIVFAILGVVFIYIVISAIVNNGSSNGNSNSNIFFQTGINRYIYKFADTLDLETTRGTQEQTISMSGMPNFGVLSEFYDGIYREYVDDTLVMETPSGKMTIAVRWLDEGLAKEVKEPDFGSIQKFFLKADGSIKARYTDAKMKDMIKYINELSALGFNKVTLDNKNKKRDFYYYAAKNKDGKAVNLNYENGEFTVSVFN